MFKKFIKTYPAKKMLSKLLVLTVLYFTFSYFILMSGEPLVKVAVNSIKFFAFMLGGYSLIQNYYRGVELSARRAELDSANGDANVISSINEQLESIKKDKETGQSFLVYAFFIMLGLYLVGKA